MPNRQRQSTEGTCMLLINVKSVNADGRMLYVISAWMGMVIFKISRRLLASVTIHTYIMAFFSRTTWVGQYQKDKPFRILLKQQMMGWQWHQLNHMQIICTSLLTDNHTSTSSLHVLLQAGCPSCCPTNSAKALKALLQAGCPSCCPTNSAKALKALASVIKQHVIEPTRACTVRFATSFCLCAYNTERQYISTPVQWTRQNTASASTTGCCKNEPFTTVSKNVLLLLYPSPWRQQMATDWFPKFFTIRLSSKSEIQS